MARSRCGVVLVSVLFVVFLGSCADDGGGGGPAGCPDGAAGTADAASGADAAAQADAAAPADAAGGDAGGESLPYPLTLRAAPVAALPAIDGAADDEAWQSATAMTAGTTSWKAVYTETDLAILVTWADRNLAIDTVGSWLWDEDGAAWTRTVAELPAGAKYHKEFFGIAFDIERTTIRSEGCLAFCHTEDGVPHHNLTEPGARADVWLLLTKHGFGPGGLGPEDSGWLAGAAGVAQEGTVLFDPENAVNPRSPLLGRFTFRGWAEDKVMTSLDDDTFASSDTPAAQYCARCHDHKPGVAALFAGHLPERARTFGDTGELGYFRNGDLPDAAPLYIETAPADFADALVLTQDEIDAGEAAVVADLTPAELAGYWERYAALGAVLPELVLKAPTGSQSDVQVAATWASGTWTLELTRQLQTGNPDDVQFADLDKAWFFAATLPGGPAPLLNRGGSALVFEP